MDKSRHFKTFSSRITILASLIVIIVLLATLPTLAQGDDEQTGMFITKRIFYAGVVGGVNLAQVDGDNFAGYYKVGLNVGGIGYVQIARRVSLSWELLYSQKGSKSNAPRLANDDTTVITKYGIKANYAEIPIMINFFDKYKSHIGFGFSYNRLVNSSETLQMSPNVPINLNKYPFKPDDWEFVAGAMMKMYKGLFLNLRFEYSIIPFRDNVPPNFSRASDYNNLWNVRLMYLFM